MKVWAYIHPELNILCSTWLQESVPEGVQTVELEVETPDDIIYDGTQIRLKTQEEKLQEQKQKKLAELKNYVAYLLSPTDYIVIKILETQALKGETEVEILKQEYSAQLQQRETIRAWNQEMEQAINNAQTAEELRTIRIKFE
jgi:hypothetical protein